VGWVGSHERRQSNAKDQEKVQGFCFHKFPISVNGAGDWRALPDQPNPQGCIACGSFSDREWFVADNLLLWMEDIQSWLPAVTR